MGTKRDQRIAKMMGHHNPFVTGERTWSLGHKNSGDGLNMSDKPSEIVPLPAPQSTPNKENEMQVKGNRNSKKYHLSHCSGFKTLSDKNAEFFANEADAQAKGYQLAGNCKPR